MIDNVNEIQDLWLEISGFDPSKISKSGIDNHNPWRLQEVMSDLQRAKELDPSNALFVMLLEEFLDDHLKGSTTTAFEYLQAPARFDDKIALARRIRQLIAESGMPEARDELRATVLRALEFYGAGDREDIRQLIATRGSIGWLWRDALEAMDKTLDVHQFLSGDPEDAKPLYQEHVLGFWSINDALRLSANMPSGISVCLIRDADAVHSHFAFVIRNGGNLWVVTDRTPWTHPLQQRMSRRPERRLEDRMARSRFPYELLNIEYLTDEEGDVVGLNVPRQEGIIPAQTRAFRLKPIREVEADEVTWIAMMFALLTRRFFTEVWQAPELSYTGEMVELPGMIGHLADQAGLPARQEDYKALQVEPIRSVELTAERMLSEGRVEKISGTNQWMFDRYAHRIDDDKLNLVDRPQSRGLFLTDGGELQRLGHERSYHHRRTQMVELQTFDATTFGTREAVLADRVWIARYNQAKLIGLEAALEYEARKDEVEAWYRSHVEANLPVLRQAILDGEMVVSIADDVADVPEQRRKASILRRGAIASNKAARQSMPEGGQAIETYVAGFNAVNFGGYERSRGYRCFHSGRPAQDLAIFWPKVPADLAALAGVEVGELPDVLQHWSYESRHFGNHILDRLDPLDWAIQNPWSQSNFNVVLFLSRHVFPWPVQHQSA